MTIVDEQSGNAWKMIYSLMDDIKTRMDITYKEKNENVTIQDVDEIVGYIHNSIQHIITNTIVKE